MAAAALAFHAADPDAHHDEDHADGHAAGGGDALKLDGLAAPDDTTDLDASTGAHGLLPKLSGSTSEFLRGDGALATPAGGSSDHGALTGLGDDDHTQYLRADGSRGLPSVSAQRYPRRWRPVVTQVGLVGARVSGFRT